MRRSALCFFGVTCAYIAGIVTMSGTPTSVALASVLMLIAAFTIPTPGDFRGDR